MWRIWKWKEKRTKFFDLPERGFEPRIFEQIPKIWILREIRFIEPGIFRTSGLYQQYLTLKLSNLYDKKGQKLHTCMPWQSGEVLVQPCSFLRGRRQCRHLTANRRTKPSWPFFSAFLPLYASRAEWCALILILLAILCAPYNSQWAKL